MAVAREVARTAVTSGIVWRQRETFGLAAFAAALLSTGAWAQDLSATPLAPPAPITTEQLAPPSGYPGQRYVGPQPGVSGQPNGAPSGGTAGQPYQPYSAPPPTTYSQPYGTPPASSPGQPLAGPPGEPAQGGAANNQINATQPDRAQTGAAQPPGVVYPAAPPFGGGTPGVASTGAAQRNPAPQPNVARSVTAPSDAAPPGAGPPGAAQSGTALPDTNGPGAASSGAASSGAASSGAASGTASTGAATPNAARSSGAPRAPAAPATFASAPQIPTPWQPQSTAVLQLLDKVDAQSATVTIKSGQTATYGALTIAVRACEVSAPDAKPDATAFLDISDSHPDLPSFHGWMLKSDPSVSMLQHPIFDVRVLGCRP